MTKKIPRKTMALVKKLAALKGAKKYILHSWVFQHKKQKFN